MGTLAHLSDLHLGLGPQTLEAAAGLCRALIDEGVDHAVVTGDVTHRGLRAELDLFRRAFAPLLEDGRVTVVPGNHDRLGDEVGRDMMDGARVRVVRREGLYLVCADSTGPHNRSSYRSHGSLDAGDIAAIERALEDAPPGALALVALHHHPLPLPEEHLLERLSSLCGLPFAAELENGRALLERICGRCDAVLHGHRHVPATDTLVGQGRPLHLFNAGSSTQLGSFRLFDHDRGHLTGVRLVSRPLSRPISIDGQGPDIDVVTTTL